VTTRWVVPLKALGQALLCRPTSLQALTKVSCCLGFIWKVAWRVAPLHHQTQAHSTSHRTFGLCYLDFQTPPVPL
jgi:hypothetical protein